MPDSAMIQRVAKAIYEARYPQYEWEHCKAAATRPVDRAAKKEVAETLGAARAAIEAMRKPTQSMLDATGGECRKWAPGAWDLMVEAAIPPSLKEQEEGN